MEKNQGTYVCTNLAIQMATGKYICRLDADDTLTKNAIDKLITTFEKSEKDIVRYKSNRGSGEIGIAYKKKEIIDAIGYYDSVRFGADTEFKDRLGKFYPNGKSISINDTLYIVNTVPNSLTTSAATRNGNNHRNDYLNRFRNWHRSNKKCYIEFPQTTRPFPVHDIMKP